MIASANDRQNHNTTAVLHLSPYYKPNGARAMKAATLLVCSICSVPTMSVLVQTTGVGGGPASEVTFVWLNQKMKTAMLERDQPGTD